MNTISMTEKDIQIITKEKYQDEESAEQKIIFDNNIFEQIKGKELDLSVEKNIQSTNKKKNYVKDKRKNITW